MKTQVLILLFIVGSVLPLLSQSPCSGSPSSNSIVPMSATVCPSATVGLSLASTYTTIGIIYQWYHSTISSVGQWTAIPTGTNATYTTGPINVTTWFRVVITCTNSNQSFNPAVAQIVVPSTATNTVPYFEDFSGISVTNQLPNCSWTAPMLGTTALTFTTPSKMAAFYNSPFGTNHFYTNAVLLHAGITYSGSLFYKNDLAGQNSWSNLQLRLGPTQSTTGLSPIASTGTFVTATAFAPLSNTFNVQTSGMYYIAVSATGTNSGSSNYLYWDDLSITIPCSHNSPQVFASATSETVCAGESVNLIAYGADTFSWSTGATVPGVVINPMATAIYSVTGTNTLSGCAATQTLQVVVNPVPSVSVTSSPTSLFCSGSGVTLTAFGADTYTWNTNTTGSVTVVNPNITTSYSVLGSNSVNCTHMGTILITVSPLPVIVAMASQIQICDGDTVWLSGMGASSFTWSAMNFSVQGNPVAVTPSTSLTYTVTGLGGNGCSNKTLLMVQVDPKPVVTITSSLTVLCKGASTNFYSNGAMTYMWHDGSQGTAFNITPTVTGIFTISVIGTENTANCKASATATLQVEECTSVRGQNVERYLDVYPSPGNGLFFLKNSAVEEVEILITDAQGRIIFDKKGGAELIIDITASQSGVYFCKIKSKSEQRQIKLVKQ